jgi:hypothetical protein
MAVDGSGITVLDFEMALHAKGGGDAVDDLAHLVLRLLAGRGAEGAYGAGEMCLLGQDVVGIPGMETGDAYDRRLERIDASAHHALQRLYQRAAGKDGVRALVRHGGMCPASGKSDIETVG